MNFKLECKILVDVSAVITEGKDLLSNTIDIYNTLHKKEMPFKLKRFCESEKYTNKSAYFFFDYGKTNIERIKKKDFIIDLLASLWLYYYTAVTPNVNAERLTNEIDKKINLEEGKLIKTKKSKDLFFSNDYDLPNNIAGISIYTDLIKQAHKVVNEIFLKNEELKHAATIFSIDDIENSESIKSRDLKKETINKITDIDYELIILAASVVDASSLLESCLRTMKGKYSTNLIKDNQLILQNKIAYNTCAKVYWENNVHSFQDIKNKKLPMDLLRSAWLYIYIANNPNTTPHDLLTIINEKYDLERKKHYISEYEISKKNEYILYKILLSKDFNEDNLSITSELISNKFYDEIKDVHANLHSYFLEQGYAFRELCNIYSYQAKKSKNDIVEDIDSSLIKSKTPIIKTDLEVISELRKEIAYYEHIVAKHSLELEETEENTIIDIINAMNDSKFGCPLDKLYEYRTDDNLELRSLAINFFNAIGKFGIKTIKDNSIGQKVSLSELTETEYRKDLNTKGLGEQYTIIAPGYKYKNTLILPIKIKEE